MYNHHYFHDPEDAAVLALQQGVNLYLGPMPPLTIYSFLRQAYAHGRISRALLEARARDLFRLRLRLGEFDPPQMIPFNYCTPLIFTGTYTCIFIYAVFTISNRRASNTCVFISID